MTFNTDNPNSLFNCLTRARENARGIRENISAEMWENLNTLYWTLRDAPARFDESPDDFYRQVMTGSMLFQGLTDQTLPHDQRWHFTQLGKYLERIDVTCRVIETKFGMLKSIDPSWKRPSATSTGWRAASCCSIEAYRPQQCRRHGSAARRGVSDSGSGFSAQHSLLRRHSACGDRGDPRRSEPACRRPRRAILGRLKTQLDYAEAAEIAKPGVPHIATHRRRHCRGRGGGAGNVLSSLKVIEDPMSNAIRRLRVRHVTRYAYDRMIERSTHRMHLRPDRRLEADRHRTPA